MILSNLSKARNLLELPTPLDADCGDYCNNACCQSDQDGQGGMLLFPGEEGLYANSNWAHVSSLETLMPRRRWNLLTCAGTCPRNERPLACRIFPLSFSIDAGDAIALHLDRRAWALCPLMNHGLDGLSPAFVDSVHKALKLIAQTPEGVAFLRDWQVLEDQYATL